MCNTSTALLLACSLITVKCFNFGTVKGSVNTALMCLSVAKPHTLLCLFTTRRANRATKTTRRENRILAECFQREDPNHIRSPRGVAWWLAGSGGVVFCAFVFALVFVLVVCLSGGPLSWPDTCGRTAASCWFGARRGTARAVCVRKGSPCRVNLSMNTIWLYWGR